MAISSLGMRTTNLTITQACWETRTTSVSPRVLEVSIFQAVAAVQSLGLGLPAVRGITPANIAFQMDDPILPTSIITGALSWNTSPTAPATFSRRWNSAATAGVAVIWTFPRGLLIPVANSIVVWNITAATASDINFVCDE